MPNILTTHVGSLPRGNDLVPLLLARDQGTDGRMHMTVRVAPDRAGIVRAKFGAENITAAGAGAPH